MTKPTSIAIDASPAFAEKLRRLLSGANALVHELGDDATSASELAESADCVLVWHEVPGQEVIARLQKLIADDGLPASAIVVIADEAGPTLRRQALRTGAMEVVEGALLDAEALLAAIEDAITRFRYLRGATDSTSTETTGAEGGGRTRWSESALTAVMAAMPAAVFLADKEGRILHANEQAEDLFGTSRTSSSTASPFEAVSAWWPDSGEPLQPSECPLARAIEEQVAIKGQIIQIERSDNQECRTLVTSSAPVLDPAKRLRGAVLVTVDITEQRNAELELKRSEELVRTIAENSTQGFAMMNEQGICTYANRAWLQMTGYSQEELASAQLHNLVHHHYPDGRPFPISECPIDRALPENFDIRAHEDLFFRKDGSNFPVLCAASPIFKDGRPVSTVIEIRDVTATKRAEAQLLEREQRLAFHVENSPLAVVEWDADLRCIRWTGQAEKMFGWSADEILNRRLTDLHLSYEGDRKKVSEILARLAHGRERHNVSHNRNYRRDGSIGYYEWYNSARFDAEGRLMSVFSLVLDVSDRQEVEAALRDSEARAKEAAAQADAERRLLDTVLEAAPAGIILADANGKLVRMNPANELLWGPAPPCDSVDGYQHWKGWWADQSDRHGRRLKAKDWAMARALEGETVRGDILEIEPFDRPGKRLTMVNTAAPVKDADGRISGAVVAQMDISALVEAEAAQRESESRFRALADNIAQLAWIADHNGDIFWYNRRWLEFTGTSLEQMLAEGWLNVFHPDHAQRVDAKFKQHIDTGEPWEDIFPLRGSDGQYRWFLSRAVPVYDERQEIVRWFGTNTDITGQRQAEEALREADRRKDEFLAILAHELRNPLAPVYSAVHILRRSTSTDPMLARARDIIDRQVGHMTRLIDDLLDVSRIARGKMQLQKEQCDLRDIARQTAEDYRATLESAGLTLEITVASQPLCIEADPVRMAQMISNYLQNARRFTEPGGLIQVRAQEDSTGRFAEVEVIDTGVGIDPALLLRLFDPFSQADQGLARSKGGLGLGLTLNRGLAELHGGEVSADSKGPGQGARFSLRIPLTTVEAQALPVREEPSKSAGGYRILIIEDNQDAAETLGTLLELIGHQVRLAFDGQTALPAARDYLPEVVISDIGLPGALDGYGVARALRAEPGLEGTYLIALSGYADEESRRRSREAGFNTHLAKPTDIATLERALAEVARA